MRIALCLALSVATLGCPSESNAPPDPPDEQGGAGGAGGAGGSGSMPMDASTSDSSAPQPAPDAAVDGQSDEDAATVADASADAATPPLPCSIDVEDPALPGVRLHVEGDRCRVQSGQEHEFRYTLELDAPIAYTAPDSGGGCSRCGGYGDDPLALIDFSIGADQTWYCLCDVGCCPPTTSSMHTLLTGTFTDVIVWPGRAWNGPSDTDEPLGAPFPAGDYDVSVTFAVPGIGSVTARLPIEVFGDGGAGGGASCEVGGQVYASGTGGIDDPQSCNTCTCDDGTLACTEIGCPEPCADGTAYGTSCSQCGPTDACEVVRHACLPTCDTSSDCELGELWFCGDGVCRNVCG